MSLSPPAADLNELLSHNLTISFDPLKDVIRTLYDAVQDNQRRIADMEMAHGAEPSETKEDDAVDTPSAPDDSKATGGNSPPARADDAAGSDGAAPPVQSTASTQHGATDLSPLERRIDQLEASIKDLRSEREQKESAPPPASDTASTAPPERADRSAEALDDRVRSLETTMREVRDALQQREERPGGRSEPPAVQPAPLRQQQVDASATESQHPPPRSTTESQHPPPPQSADEITHTERPSDADEAVRRLQLQVNQIQSKVDSMQPASSSASSPAAVAQEHASGDEEKPATDTLTEILQRLSVLESARIPSEEGHLASRIGEAARPASPENVAGSRPSHDSPPIEKVQEAMQGRCDRLDDTTSKLRQQVGSLEDTVTVLQRRLDAMEPRIGAADERRSAGGGAVGESGSPELSGRVQALEEDAGRVRSMGHLLCTAAVQQARISSALAGTTGDDSARSRVFRCLESLESARTKATGDDGDADAQEAYHQALGDSISAVHDWMDSVASRSQGKSDASELMHVRDSMSRMQSDLDALRRQLQRSTKELEEQLSQVVTDVVGAAAGANGSSGINGINGSSSAQNGGGGNQVDWSKLIQIIDEKADRAALEGLASVDELESKADRRELAQLYRMVQQLKARLSSSSSKERSGGKPSNGSSPDTGDWAFLSGKPLRGFHCLSCGRDLDRLAPPKSTHVPSGSMPVAPLPSHTLSRSHSPHRDGDSVYGGESCRVLPNGQVLHRHSPERPGTSQSVPGQRSSPAKKRSTRPATSSIRRKRPQTSVPRSRASRMHQSDRASDRASDRPSVQVDDWNQSRDESAVLPPLGSPRE